MLNAISALKCRDNTYNRQTEGILLLIPEPGPELKHAKALNPFKCNPRPGAEGDTVSEDFLLGPAERKRLRIVLLLFTTATRVLYSGPVMRKRFGCIN